MIAIQNYCSNIFKMVTRHPIISAFAIILSFLSLFLSGITFNLQQSTTASAVDYDNTYGSQEFLFTSEALADNLYYNYLEDKRELWFTQLLFLKQLLLSSDQFTFFVLMEQPLELFDCEIPDLFLVGYEEGDADNSKYIYNEEQLYYTKALEVSDAFFEEFSIELSDGERFSEFDYEYSNSNAIPVLLGNAFKDYYSIGDKFEGYYLLEKCSFVVKGFLDEGSFYYSHTYNDFISCERYIVVPALNVSESSDFSKQVLLQQMNGIISSTLGYEKTNEIFQQYLNEAGLTNWDIYIVNPDYDNISSIETYASMTAEVAEQFTILVIIVLLFACISVVSVVCGILKESQIDLGILLLCGSSFAGISAIAAGVAGSILLAGDVMASLLLALNENLQAFVFVQMIVAIILLFSCSSCVLYLRSMNISEIVGGKE